MTLPICSAFELTRSTPPSATYHASFSGWAAFDASACQLEPREGFQWLSFENDVRTTGPNLLERQAHGTMRAARDGTVSGVARVSWDGTTSVASICFIIPSLFTVATGFREFLSAATASAACACDERKM